MSTATIESRSQFSYRQTLPPPAGRDALDDLEALATREACGRVWADHTQRVDEGRPYTDPVTADDLQSRIDKLRAQG